MRSLSNDPHIYVQMLSHKPMFPGSTTDEQLNLIFQRLGTPTTETHPTTCSLPLLKATQFRLHSAKSLLHPPRINHERADLLHQMLKVGGVECHIKANIYFAQFQYEGRSRITAKDAMHHPTLRGFPDSLFNLADTESVLSLPGVTFVNELRGNGTNYGNNTTASRKAQQQMNQRH